MIPALYPNATSRPVPLLRVHCRGCYAHHAYRADQWPGVSLVGHHRTIGVIPGARCTGLMVTGHADVPGVAASALDDEDVELIADMHLELGDTLWPAFIAWVDAGEHTLIPGTTLPDATAFLERDPQLHDSPAQWHASLDLRELVTLDQHWHMLRLDDHVRGYAGLDTVLVFDRS